MLPACMGAASPLWSPVANYGKCSSLLFVLGQSSSVRVVSSGFLKEAFFPTRTLCSLTSQLLGAWGQRLHPALWMRVGGLDAACDIPQLPASRAHVVPQVGLLPVLCGRREFRTPFPGREDLPPSDWSLGRSVEPCLAASLSSSYSRLRRLPIYPH